mmetsp:Transcript_31493/g.121914  ORF Transcript_31493/g.121914 Transcript_31493/m.121914 type:complete len:130 (-) Transcript_31493:2985-3374(-)
MSTSLMWTSLEVLVSNQLVKLLRSCGAGRFFAFARGADIRIVRQEELLLPREACTFNHDPWAATSTCCLLLLANMFARCLMKFLLKLFTSDLGRTAVWLKESSLALDKKLLDWAVTNDLDRIELRVESL